MLNFLFSFAIFSVLGWFIEVIYRSVANRRFINPGLLKGPYLILYGSGGLLLLFLAQAMQGSHVFLKILLYGLSLTILEYISGVISLRFFHKRLWDYSENFLNYKGIICLKFSIYWTLLALFFDYVFYPFYDNILKELSPSIKFFFGLGILILMIIDLYYVIKKEFFSYSKEDMKEIKKEFFSIAERFYKIPEVYKLKDFTHHRDKTRLEHVLEVAFYSFLVGKKLNLDLEATIKGAILHDLFFYDWLREGPRLHGFRHPKISLENAQKVFPLSKKERDIIKKHMWPLTLTPPFYLESFVVAMVDSFCSFRDYIPGLRRHLFKEELK